MDTGDTRLYRQETDWPAVPPAADPARWEGIRRPYRPEDVERLRGSVRIEYTVARRGAERLWHLLRTRPMIPALGAMTGIQAVQQVRAGLESIYLSGWQVAADANLAGETYPDLSLYPVNSVPTLVRRINRALLRADQIDRAAGRSAIDWLAPIVADAEAGFGGMLNVFELVRALIDAGAAGIHLEDQASAQKKCGHMGGKVLIPTATAIRHLVAARLAADVMGVPTVIVARTDALSAALLTSDVDDRDRPLLTGARTAEGFFVVRSGLEAAIRRGLAYAPYADLLWYETSTPDLGEAREFAAAIHREFPGKWLAYNCSPSFNWRRHLSDTALRAFQEELATLGYRYQFVTLAGFHTLALGSFDLARRYREQGMAAYADLQAAEFQAEAEGYTAVRHQQEVGAGYFDDIALILNEGDAVTTALRGSTEAADF
jgi:isocitrate lyase